MYWFKAVFLVFLVLLAGCSRINICDCQKDYNSKIAVLGSLAVKTCEAYGQKFMRVDVYNKTVVCFQQYPYVEVKHDVIQD